MTEAEVLECAANLSKGSSTATTARAGRLRVSATGIEFGPRHIDRLTTAPLSIPAAEVQAVRVEPASIALTELLSGGFRKRLRVERTDGTVELFVVNQVEKRVEQIRAILGIGS